MNKKRLYFIGGAVLVFLFFTRLIPEYVIYDSEFMWGLVAAAGVGTLLYFGLRPDPEKMYNPEHYESQKPKRTFAIVLTVVAAIATLFAVFIMTIPRTTAYIKKHSVITKGYITDGKSTTTTRRGNSSTSYELDLSFNYKGNTYKQTVDVDGSDWSHAGKGMPVMVAFVPDHPGMCKVLFNMEHVKKYTSSDQVKQLTLEGFKKVAASPLNNLLPELEKFSVGWTKDETEKGTEYYYHPVFKAELVKTEGILYYNQQDNGELFEQWLNEARKKMETVYDSIPVNYKKGTLLKADSLQMRFQRYSETTTDTDNQYGFPAYKRVTNYVVALTSKKIPLLLPGDLQTEKTDQERMEEERQKMIEKALNPQGEK